MMWIEFIIRTILLFIVLLCTYYIVPKLKENNIYDEVILLVQAAEQIFKDAGMGSIKFQYVFDIIEEKYNISEDEIRNMIEAAVYDLNLDKKN